MNKTSSDLSRVFENHNLQGPGLNELLLVRLFLVEEVLNGSLEIIKREQQLIRKKTEEYRERLDEQRMIGELRKFVELNEAHAKLCQSVIEQNEEASPAVRNILDRAKERSNRLRDGITIFLSLTDFIQPTKESTLEAWNLNDCHFD